MDSRIVILEDGTFNLQFFLKIGLKLSIEVVNHRLVTKT
jgi:hypothetical protein